jgi:exodeoxyribonuclease VII large subunit
VHGLRILSVSEAVGRIQGLLSEDKILNNLWLRGEISNFRAPRSGHWYFTLKDSVSSLRCVMFRSRANRTAFLPQDGLRVIIRGYVSLYERDGTLQIYVEELQADGLGALWLAFQQLKEKLAEEGLFAPARKRTLPGFPKVIGIVTSPTGAAFQDLRTIIHRRCPIAKIVLAPASVQGQEAPQEIAAALSWLNQRPEIEVIIIGRGGGSLEELWAFNTEIVARAVFASRVPVISAVGHETDYSITDWVADYRAATPSAAAEIVVPVLTELTTRLSTLQNHLGLAMTRYLRRQREQVQQLANRRVLTNPRVFTELRKTELNRKQRELKFFLNQLLQNKRTRLAAATDQLMALSPLGVLGRGYAICRKQPTRELVRCSTQVELGDTVEVCLNQGWLICQVEDKQSGTARSISGHHHNWRPLVSE